MMTAERREYLKELSEDYGMPLDVVFFMADLLGEMEDYDGLVAELANMEHLYS